MLFGLFKATDEQESVNQAFDKWQSENDSINESQDDFYDDDICEADKPQTRLQSSLSVQAACSDHVDYSTDETGNTPSWLGL